MLACYGTNGLTREHQAAIRALPRLQEIIFAFDGDDAGSKAAAKYAAMLQEQLSHIRLSTLQLPAGEDINSLGVSHEAGIFEQLLMERTGIFSSSEKENPAGNLASASELPAPPANVVVRPP